MSKICRWLSTTNSPNDAEIYLHRVGRTGRAGKVGLAISLVTSRQRRGVLREIETTTGNAAIWRDAPARQAKRIALVADMRTVIIQAGRADKLRAGDVLGAITRENLIPAQAVGKIGCPRHANLRRASAR